MKTSSSIQIEAPVPSVFLWLEDNECLMKWVPNLIEDTPLVETPEITGSRFQQVFLENGKRMEMTGEIAEYVENERMRVVMTGKMFNLDVEYTLKARHEDQTELTQNTEIRFKGMMVLFAPIMRLMSLLSSHDPQADAHEALKSMVEAEHQSES